MSFRFYTNMISQASRTMAATMFFVGLGLIGFGVIILALPEIFALIAAIMFFVAGVCCGIIAFRIFLAQRRFKKTTDDEISDYRESVEIFADRYRDDDN